MEHTVINNRELAGLIWLLVIGVVVVVLARRNDRKVGFKPVLKGLAKPKILVSLLSYVVWLVGAVAVAWKVNIWDLGVLKPTILWAILSGIALFFGVTDVLQGKTSFKSVFLATIGISATLELIVGFKSFPLWVELPAQLLVGAALIVTTVARQSPDQAKLVRVCTRIVVAYGFAALIWVIWYAVKNWEQLDRAALAREGLLPIWLTPAAMTYVYFLAVWSAYELAFMRINWKAGGKPSWRQKLAVISIAKLRLAKLRMITGRMQLMVADESGFQGARRLLQTELLKAKSKALAEV